MACIVLELMYRELGRPPLSVFASAIQIDMVGGAPVAVEKHVGDMLSHGSRYLNIEANLGHGICFVLGCDLPETQYVIVTRTTVLLVLIKTVGTSYFRRKMPLSIKSWIFYVLLVWNTHRRFTGQFVTRSWRAGWSRSGFQCIIS